MKISVAKSIHRMITKSRPVVLIKRRREAAEPLVPLHRGFDGLCAVWLLSLNADGFGSRRMDGLERFEAGRLMQL
jgi:hypothetical protein